ncbi:MAG: hypothetical protein PGN09_00070 [Sphingomonas fennica]
MSLNASRTTAPAAGRAVTDGPGLCLIARLLRWSTRNVRQG